MGVLQLLERMKHQDDEAFGEFYEKTFGLVYFCVKNYLQDEQDIQEVVQDVFWAAYRRVGYLEKERSWRSWLGGIARNLSLKKLRSRQAYEKALHSSQWGMPVVDLRAQPALQVENGLLLSELLMRLPAEQRTAVTLYYLKDLKVGEIARMTCCPAGTVKSRLNYARKTMRDAQQI